MRHTQSNGSLWLLFFLSTVWVFIKGNTTPIIPLGLVIVVIMMLVSRKCCADLWKKRKSGVLLSIIAGTLLGYIGTGFYVQADFIHKYQVGAQIGARTLFEAQYGPRVQQLFAFDDGQGQEVLTQAKSYVGQIIEAFNSDEPLSILGQFVFVQGGQLTPESAEALLPEMKKQVGMVQNQEFKGYVSIPLQEDPKRAAAIDMVFEIDASKGKFTYMTISLIRTDQGFKITTMNFLGEHTKLNVITESDPRNPSPDTLVEVSLGEPQDTPESADEEV